MAAFFKRCLFAMPLWLCMTMAQAHMTAGDTPPDYPGDTRGGDAIHVMTTKRCIFANEFVDSTWQVIQLEVSALEPKCVF